jgi:hypothetical protein
MNIREAHNAKQLGRMHKKELVAEILWLRAHIKRLRQIESDARWFAQQYYEPFKLYQALMAALAVEEHE